MTTQQTSQQIEKQFLDSMYLISHSNKTKITYQTALNHFRKFAQTEYNTDETNIILKINTLSLVLTSFNFDPNQLKSKKNLLF